MGGHIELGGSIVEVSAPPSPVMDLRQFYQSGPGAGALAVDYYRSQLAELMGRDRYDDQATAEFVGRAEQVEATLARAEVMLDEVDWVNRLYSA